MAAQTGSYDPRELSVRVSAGARLAAGIVAGVIGGLLLIGTMVTYADVTGAGWDTPLKALGAFVYGLESYITGPVPMLAGALIQLGFSIVVGIIFALFVSRATSVIATMIVGMLVGLAVWVAMDLALMPIAYLAAHVLFGIGLGTTPIFVRAFSRERRSRSSRIRAAQAQPT